MGQKVNFGAWWRYAFDRLGDLQLADYLYRMPAQRSGCGHVHLTSFGDRRDRALFPAAYADPGSGVSANSGGPGMRVPVCVDKLVYTGHAAIAAAIAMADIVDVMLAIDAQAYSFQASNV
jgi:5-methyltetrahydropteroyltriglutamate--homocysteine methyltransferase